MSSLESVPDQEALLEQLGWIRDLARKLVGDRHLAEDLAQQTCVVALEQRPRDHSRLRQWLGSILRNFARQEARSTASRARREQSLVREPEPSALDTLERASIQHRLIAAVLRLSEVYRTTILLRFFDGLPQREIALRMNTTAATVNSRLTRALEQLRRDLDRSPGGRRTWVAALVPVLERPTGFATSTLPLVLMMNKLKLTIAGVCAAGVVAALLLFNSDDPNNPGESPPVAARPSGLSAGSPGSGAGGGVGAAPHREALAPTAARDLASRSPLLARGRVLFADGAPAPGVALRMSGAEQVTATSDPTGYFALEVSGGGEIVAASTEHVTVLAGAYAPDSTIEPRVVVAPAIAIGGIVANEDGQPLASAHLRLHLPDDFEGRFSDNLDRSKRQRWEAMTDERGEFSLQTIPQIGGSFLRASREPFVPEVVGAPQYSDDRMYIVLHGSRPEGDRLRGRVVDPSGSVVSGARVAMGLTSQVTNDRGEFEIEHRRTGDADRIVAVKEGFIPGSFEPRSREWPPFVELRLEGEALSISGQVVDREGTPVENALVWALDTATFGDMPVQLEFLSAGGIVPPGETLELPVIEDDTPAPVSNNMNHARDPSAFWYYESTDGEGRFTLPGLTANPYRLRAMHPDSVLTATSEPILAGTTSVTIQMPMDSTHPMVRGQILTEEGHAIEGISILQVCEVYDAQYRLPDTLVDQKLIRHGARTKTDAEGMFTFRDVPKDRIHLSIYGDEILPYIRELSAIGDPANLNITVRARYHFELILDDPSAADTVAARDTDGEGVPLSILRSGSMNTRAEVPLQNGRSGVLAVSGRMHTALLLKNGEVVAEVPVTLVPGETTVVRR